MSAEPTDIRRILIVRPTALGDVCRSVPALATLRTAYPEAQIDWLVHDSFADAVAHHPGLSGVVRFPRRRFASMWYNPAALVEAKAWALSLARRRYDLAIDLQGLFRSGLFTRLTGAARRVGYANARELAWLGYNERHHVDRNLHAVDRTLALLRAAGYEPQPDMTLHVGTGDARWLEGLLAEHGWTNRGYVCLAPTAQWLCKCWPRDSYLALARRLLTAGGAGARLAVIASPGEHGYVAPLIEALGRDGAAVLLPTTTVGQMMALVKGSALLVCNDSAPLHVAVGLNRPVVAIFGPTDPALVGPYRRPEAVVQPPGLKPADITRYRRKRNDQSLITRVSVEAVWDKIRESVDGITG